MFLCHDYHDTCLSSLGGVECPIFPNPFLMVRWEKHESYAFVGGLSQSKLEGWRNMTWFRCRNPWGQKLLTIQEWNRKTSNLPPEISGRKLLSSQPSNYVTLPKCFGGTACDARIIDAMDTLTAALNICRLVALTKTQQAWCRCGSASGSYFGRRMDGQSSLFLFSFGSHRTTFQPSSIEFKEIEEHLCGFKDFWWSTSSLL